MERKLLPIGIDDYKKLIEGNYYYVDKTLFVKELIDHLSEVNLFTRPRRFGKTLNLSMLRYFFEKPVDGSSNVSLFQDKKIMAAGKKYVDHQEQYPVIELSLKSGKQPEFELAYTVLRKEIRQEFERHSYVLESLESIHQKKFLQILNDTAEKADWYQALAFLAHCLEEYHKQKVIILLDEYDVPLENAYYCGFYKEMTDFIRSLFESALKGNPSLKLAVLTGCLRISKESIFTGLNNLNVISIFSTVYHEHFGFTQREVDNLLSDYHMESKSDLIKEWYDGYIFGKTEVYNPWSLINFLQDACLDEYALPTEYWSNTSSNTIVKDIICRADMTMKSEIEHLIAGGTIQKKVCETITYEDIYSSMDNLWNFLLFTGYLKKVSLEMVGSHRYVTMKIPNRELKNIFENQISEWFRDDIRKKNLTAMYRCMLEGDAEGFQKELALLLYRSISYMDNSEAFYHGFLLGVLANLGDYQVVSNRESGDGRYDICVKGFDLEQPPVLLEFKIADKFAGLEDACDRALEQMERKQYGMDLGGEGYLECLYMGVGFWRKRCKVKSRKVLLR